MNTEEPPTKKRKTKDSSRPSPKKLKVKKFAQVSHFDENIKIKQEYDSDIQEEQISDISRLTASSIEEDDEVWIVQCPLDIDPTSLIGESLTFSESCMVTDSNSSKQYDIETNTSPKKLQCILPKKKGAKYEICNLNVNGMLILSERTGPLAADPAAYSEEDVKDFIHPPILPQRNPHLLPQEISQLESKGSKRKSKKMLTASV